MSVTLPFSVLLERLRGGDQDAALLVYRRFAPALLAEAQRRLPSSLRPKVDPEDITQSVFRSFFRCHGDGRFNLVNWENLWGLLLVITGRKCLRQIEHFATEDRDVRREMPLADGPEAENALTLLDRAPDPLTSVLFAETMEQLLSGLEEEGQHILLLHLQGFSYTEIGSQVGYSARTVRRTIGRARSRLVRLREAEADDEAPSGAVS